jgi:hypothetical protein
MAADRRDRRKQLAKMSKRALIAMCQTGIPNPRGGKTRIWGAYSLDKWTKDELVDTILDVEYPPPVTMDELPFGGLS